MFLTLFSLIRLGLHRNKFAGFWQPALGLLCFCSRSQLVLMFPAYQLPVLRRAVLLVVKLVRKRATFLLPPPGSPLGLISNWKRRRRPLPAVLAVLAPSQALIGREGVRLGLPVVAPAWSIGWASHPFPFWTSNVRGVLRLLAITLYRYRRRVR